MRLEFRHIAAATLLFCALSSLEFLFNLSGLGPQPEGVLGEAFFAAPSTRLGEVELLVDGERAFAVVDGLLERAEREVHVQTYIWKDDETGQSVVARLKQAAARGVQVVVSKDMLGTVFEAGDLLSGRPSPVFTEAGLRGVSGVTVSTALAKEPDHSKYFIVDGQDVVFGGMNIADEYHHDWHDYMVHFSSPERTEAFSKRVLGGSTLPHGPERVTANGKRVSEIRPAHVELIDHAQRRIVVEHAYISDEPVVAALERAAARGVTVDIVVPAEPDTHGAANKVALNRLLQQPGARVWLFPEMSHAKLMLVDDTFIALGSANLTRRSMVSAREVTWFAHAPADAEVLTALQAQIEADIARCTRRTEPFELTVSERLMAPLDRVLW